jgi:hypothetical protein
VRYTIVRRPRLAAALAMVLSVGGILVVGQIPRTVDGEGVVYGHLWCLGVKFDSGETLPVSFWPSGYRVESGLDTNRPGVLRDSTGAVVLTEGQRVRIHGTVGRGTGDTPCAYTTILTVSTFEAEPVTSRLVPIR